jgi:hypothetical protein
MSRSVINSRSLSLHTSEGNVSTRSCGACCSIYALIILRHSKAAYLEHAFPTLERSFSQPASLPMPIGALQLLSISSQEAVVEEHVTSALHRLPPELLVSILYEVQSAYILGSYTRWLEILLLCHRTWTVALDSPELWSRIAFGCRGNAQKLRHWRHLCVQRSQQRPLDLTIRLDPYYVPSVDCSEILQLASRMQKCDLTITRNYYVPGYASTKHEELRDALLTTSWPMLEVFHIYAETARMDLNDQLLGGRSDILTRLSIASGPLRLESLPLLPHLQHLTLSQLDLNDRHVQLREFLANSLDLISLDIHSHISQNSKHMPGSMKVHELVEMAGSPKIRLPRLRLVRLSGLPDVCSLILLMIVESYEQLVVEIDAQQLLLLPDFDLNAAFTTATACACQGLRYPSANTIPYEFKYSFHLTDDVPILEFSPTQYSLQNLQPGVCRLYYRLAGYLDADIVSDFARVATDINIQTDRHCLDVLSAISSAHSAVHLLSFVQWDSIWKPSSEKIAALEDTLRVMKENGATLKVLQLDCSMSSYGVERDWVEKGIIEFVRYVDGSIPALTAQSDKMH